MIRLGIRLPVLGIVSPDSSDVLLALMLRVPMSDSSAIALKTSLQGSGPTSMLDSRTYAKANKKC